MNTATQQIDNKEFFRQFLGVDEINVPNSQVTVQLLEFDVNMREYKVTDTIHSAEIIVQGNYAANNSRIEITFKPSMKNEIKKMKHFIKLVEDGKQNPSPTRRAPVINLTLHPTKVELKGSNIFASNPIAIHIEENGMFFRKNLTAHLTFSNNNLFLNIKYNPNAQAGGHVQQNIVSANKTNVSNKQHSVKDILSGGGANDNQETPPNLDEQNESEINEDEDAMEKKTMTAREAEELAEDDVSFDKWTGSDDPQADLDQLIGLDNVKNKIQQMEARMKFEKRKKDAGIKESRTSNRHMIFYGEPGTGKTTVARIMTGILYNMGLIRKNQCIEVNGEMLKGKYMGASAPKTQRMVNRSLGGVLFIDEAYTIMDNFSSGGGYGKEVISVLLKSMEDHKDDLIIILAGYEQEMEDFLDTNPGLKSRIGDKIEFVRYEPEALAKIFDLMLQGHGLNITKEARVELFNSLFDAYNNGLTSGHNGNARYVENLTEKIVDMHAHYAITLPPNDPKMFVVQKETIEEFFVSVPRTLEPHEYITLKENENPEDLVFPPDFNVSSD